MKSNFFKKATHFKCMFINEYAFKANNIYSINLPGIVTFINSYLMPAMECENSLESAPLPSHIKREIPLCRYRVNTMT